MLGRQRGRSKRRGRKGTIVALVWERWAVEMRELWKGVKLCGEKEGSSLCIRNQKVEKWPKVG